MADMMTGAEILLECLAREGVEHIFGYPGGATLPVYEVLYDHGIRHVLMRHEENACFAAGGYARASGRVGVCCATSGPGATNLVTGLADAFMDSVPLVAITGQVSTKVLGTTAFQEADTFGISMPCTKHNYVVRHVEDLPRIVHEAFYLARTGRPGPVLIDIPKDVQLSKSPFIPAEEMDLPGYRVVADGEPETVARAVQMIWQSERPVVYAGGGIISAEAAPELKEFVNFVGAPTVCTLMGLGGLPADDPHFISMPGMHGSYAANMAITHADLLIALGARFDDRVTGKLAGFAPHAKVIHVDADPSEIGKNRSAEIGILGDLKCVLGQLNGRLRETHPFSASKHSQQRQVWQRQVSQWKEQCPLASEPSEEEIKPQHLMMELDRLAGGASIVCADVGQHQMWAAQLLRFNAPRLWINSGGLGSMGFGLPAAIGAQIACPEKAVFALVGDGGFQMSIPELATIANYSLPVKVIIVNNGHLGMVRQWQELFHRNRLSAVRLDTFPDVARLAAAYGLRGLTLTNPQQLRADLENLMGQPGPCIVNVEVSPLENVYPMVPTGAAIHEMVLGPSAESAAAADASVASAPVAARHSTDAAAPVCRTLHLRAHKVPGTLQRILAAIAVQGCVVSHVTVRPATAPRELKVKLTLEGDERAIIRAAQRIGKLVSVIEVQKPRRGRVYARKQAPPAWQSERGGLKPQPWEDENELEASPVEDTV